jgi:ribosome maturation factor RimP
VQHEKQEAARRRPGVDAELAELAARIVGEADCELVDLALRASGGHRMLRVIIDRAGDRGVDLDDCQRVSRALGTALDERDLIPSRYTLEVSSPGIDRPIRTADDIRRNTGRRVAIVAEEPQTGRRTVRGRLVGSSAGCLLVFDDDAGTEKRIPLERIVDARQDVTL